MRDSFYKIITKLGHGVERATLVPEMVPCLPRFNAVVVDHHDGDTIFVNLDEALFGQHVERQSLRIVGCAAREKDEPTGGGMEALVNIQGRIPIGTPVVVTMLKWDKFGGRLDAVVSFMENGIPRDLATDLISTGWAAPWNGKGPQPKPPWPRVTS